MCGHHVAIRQKAHILAENSKIATNILMLCPTCHLMFDTHLKPKLFKAMAFLPGAPKSWETSIYDQAARASAKAMKAKAASTLGDEFAGD